MFPEYRSHASSLTYRCCSPYGRIFYKFNKTLSLTLIKPRTIWGQISTHLEHEIQMFHISQLFYPIRFWKVILAQLVFKEKLANILKHKSSTQIMFTWESTGSFQAHCMFRLANLKHSKGNRLNLYSARVLGSDLLFTLLRGEQCPLRYKITEASNRRIVANSGKHFVLSVQLQAESRFIHVVIFLNVKTQVLPPCVLLNTTRCKCKLGLSWSRHSMAFLHVNL